MVLQRVLLLSAGLWALSGLATADTIFGVCGTGFTNDTCTTQGADGSSDDFNWDLAGGTAHITDPNSAWVLDNASAKWIAPGTDETASTINANGTGPFDYTETFTLTAGEDLSTAVITGTFATDNGGTLTLNGHTIETLSGVGTFSTFTGHDFTITDTGADAGFFQLGTNTLEVAVINGNHSPTGVIVEIDSATISPDVATPEPASFGLIGLGLAALGLLGRRFRS